MKNQNKEVDIWYILQLVIWLGVILALAVFVHWAFGLLLIILTIEKK